MDTVEFGLLIDVSVILGLFVLVGFLVYRLSFGSAHRIARVLLALAALLGGVPAVLWVITVQLTAAG